MAELSAEERYEKSYEASKACHKKFYEQHEQWLSQYIKFMKKTTNNINYCIQLNEEITESAQECNKAWEGVDSSIHVVVIGIYNQGKSTMLNALLDDASNTLFKASNIPQTCEIQCVERDGICWTDTPGFEINENDDNKALEGITKLEIGLFVHKARGGELHANEIDVLHKIANGHGNTFVNNICIVLNNDINEEENIEILHNRIAEQLKNIFGTTIKIIDCNPECYQDGLREHDDELMEFSKIHQLHHWIKERYAYFEEIRLSKIDHISRLESQILYKCKTALQKFEERKNNIEYEIQQTKLHINNINNAINAIAKHKETMRQLKEELVSSDKVASGIVGGGGGAVAGALIGSFVPIVGTLIGGAVGAALGSTAGIVASNFEEKHNENSNTLACFINNIVNKKHDIMKAIQELEEMHKDVNELIREMQEIHDSWE